MPYIVQPNDRLIRRIPKKPSHINNGRITSACFKTHEDEDGLSINIESLIEENEVIYNSSTHKIAVFLAEIPINNGHECIHDEQEGNYSHGLVLGNTKPIAKKLAMASTFID